jgi:hypothetical protein
MKQDRIVPIFGCQVFETINSQYCSHWSFSGITQYVWFWEPMLLEAWECRQARGHGKVVLSWHTIQATSGATVSHAIFLSRNLDDDSSFDVGMIRFHNSKTLSGQAAQGLYEIILREDFAKMGELTGSSMFSLGVRAQKPLFQVRGCLYSEIFKKCHTCNN